MPIAIFDMDGVLYRGAQVMPHAREALDRLRRARWDVFFATNNSTATRLDYLRLLRQLVPADRVGQAALARRRRRAREQAALQLIKIPIP